MTCYGSSNICSSNYLRRSRVFILNQLLEFSLLGGIFRPLILDENNYFVDEETEIAPHLMGPPRMVDADGLDYDDDIQSLVPGRDLLLRVSFYFSIFVPALLLLQHFMKEGSIGDTLKD